MCATDCHRFPRQAGSPSHLRHLPNLRNLRFYSPKLNTPAPPFTAGTPVTVTVLAPACR